MDDDKRRWQVRQNFYMTYEEVATWGDKKPVVVHRNLSLDKALELVQSYGTDYSAHLEG